MKRVNWVILIIFLLVFSHRGFAQDEGTLEKKGRVTKAKSFFLSGGPSYKFGNNTGDYCCGLNLEAGFFKRLNRTLSIGPSISYSKFAYDESISDSFGDLEAEGNNVFYDFYEARVVYMEGGDLRLISLGFNLKVNFIPFSETKKFSFYGIAKPIVLLSNRTELTASVEHYFPPTIPAPDDRSEWGGLSGPPEELSVEDPDYDYWAADTEFSRGMNVTVGAEYWLPSGVAFFLQGTVGFTLPITHINTSEYPNTYDGFTDNNFPFVKKGFTSLNVSAGVAYSF